MRIGIITFHRAVNFGAVLQAYALSKFLRDKGHSVFIIDYVRNNTQSCKILSFYAWKTLFGLVFRNPFALLRYAASVLRQLLNNSASSTKKMRTQKESQFSDYFSQFRSDHLELTSRTYSSPTDLRNYPPEMDVYIAGSDQVWGYGNTTFSPAYYLDFGKKEVRRVSYAPSFGISKIDKHWHSDLKRNISRFDAVSVREKSGVKIINDICNVKAAHVLDPTLLIDDYRIITQNRKDEDEFLFAYRLHQNAKFTSLFNNLIKDVSDECGLKLKIISTTDDFSSMGEDLVVGVEGFLGMIAHSKMVLTNSFHGTVFAILHKKPFICFPRDEGTQGQNARMIDLLSELGLMSRYFDIEQENEIASYITDDIDWGSVYERLSIMKKHSIDYLTNAIGG
jgi:hypothetical protein